MKNETEITLKISSNVMKGIWLNDEMNLQHKLFLTGRQVSQLRKAFASNSSAYIKLLKTQYLK